MRALRVPAPMKPHKPDIDQLRDEVRELKDQVRRQNLAFRREVVDKMSALATAAFGLVAALAWNNAIQAVFKRYYPQPEDPNAIVPLLGYALVITIIAVAVILLIGRAAGRLKEAHEAQQKQEADSRAAPPSA